MTKPTAGFSTRLCSLEEPQAIEMWHLYNVVDQLSIVR
jgi:hypothetical protein